MEDVLEVYKRPYDEAYPVICMDEKPYQLLDHYKDPIAMSIKNPIAKEDYEYVRKGTASIFVFTEPLKGWRRAEALERRTRVDWAHQIKKLLTVDYADAKKVVLILDNLNVHNTASLYEAFEPQEALKLAKRLEIHYTPKHGSWLNIAEIELSVMGRQCLRQRIGDLELLNVELKGWQDVRNANDKSVDWQFTTDDARVHLRKLYPNI